MRPDEESASWPKTSDADTVPRAVGFSDRMNLTESFGAIKEDAGATVKCASVAATELIVRSMLPGLLTQRLSADTVLTRTLSKRTFVLCGEKIGSTLSPTIEIESAAVRPS